MKIAEDLKVLHGVASEGIGIAKYQKVIVKLIERTSAAEARVKELEASLLAATRHAGLIDGSTAMDLAENVVFTRDQHRRLEQVNAELEAQVEQMHLFMVRAASIHDGKPHNLWVRNLGRQARQLLADSASAEKEQR